MSLLYDGRAGKLWSVILAIPGDHLLLILLRLVLRVLIRCRWQLAAFCFDD